MTIRLFLLILFAVLGADAHTQSLDVDLTQIREQVTVPQIQGNIWAQSGFYDVSGIPVRTNTFTWSMGANAQVNVGDWNLPFAFTLGQYGSQLTKPTFGQLGVSPTYKWMKVHLGHRNLTFSPYTLGGHTFLGAGVELTPGKFRFAAMRGRLRQARRTQDNLLSILPSYRRMGTGVKVGVGNRKNFIDFIFFQGKDDPASLESGVDSTLQAAENLVGGISGRLQIGKHLHWQMDVAGSVFNRNQNSTILNNDSLEVFNYFPEQVFPLRYSSRLSFAGKTGLFYAGTNFQLGLQYERIDPEYESMGTFFFLNDLENITISPVLSLFKRRVNLSGSMGIQRNNLLDNRSESTKRLIGNATLNYATAEKPFGLTATYTNFSIQQSDGRLELSDTVRLSMVTSSINITPYWNFTDENSTRSILLSANFQELNDRNPFTRAFTDMTSSFLSATYTRFSNTSGWGVNLGGQYNSLMLLGLNTDRYGLSGGVNRNFKKGNFNLAVNTSYNLTRIAAERDGATFSLNMNMGWVPADQWQVSFYANFLQNNSTQFADYREWLGGIRLGWRW